MGVRTSALLGVVLVGVCTVLGERPVPASQTPQTADQQFLVTRWTSEEGLPQNSVMALVQTRDGYLWIGTFGGLARFDGIKFTIFNSANTPALTSNRILALYEDNTGVLWIGTEAGEIVSFRDGQFTAHAGPGAGQGGSIRAFYKDRTGMIWAGGNNGQLIRINPAASPKAEIFPGAGLLSAEEVNSICEDKDGNLWLSTARFLAWVQNGSLTTFKALSEDPGFRIQAIYPHPDGGLWVLGSNGLSRFFNHRLVMNYSRTDVPALVGRLAPGKAGNLWFGYRSDQICNSKDGVIHSVRLQEPPGYHIHSLLEDREGKLWIGTSGGGLIRIRKRRVTMLTKADGLSVSGITAIIEDRQRNVWVGTGKGLCRSIPKEIASANQNKKLACAGNWDVAALYVDKAGQVWVGKNKGIARFRDGKWTEYQLAGIRRVSSILEDRNGQMWLGTDSGLAQFRDGQIVKLHRQEDGLVHNQVVFLMEGRAGALWIGTTNGLSRFIDGAFTNFTTRESLSNGYVRAIYEDQDGALWIGTYGGGLNRLKDGQITQITAKDGLHDDFVSRILVDGNDQFWMLGNRGVFRVSRQQLNDFIAGRNKTIFCVVHDAADGMTPSEGNGGNQPAGWQMQDGRLWFPTIEGVAIVDPALNNTQPPPVIIEKAFLDGELKNIRQPLVMKSSEEQLEIHYTGLSFGKPEQVHFRYKLIGLDNDWVDAGTRRVAYYPHPPAGKYEFNVVAISPDGIWSSEPARWVITVSPPFWHTYWFLCLIGLSFMVLSWLVYRGRVATLNRRNQQQEAFAGQLIESQERERQRIAAELHDGLSQSLVIIKNRALSSLNAPGDQDRAMEQLREIAEAATQAIDEVHEVIYDLRPRQLDRLGLTGALEDLLRAAADANEWVLHVEMDEINRLLTPQSENSLFRIVQECVNNISKHAAATRVEVSVRKQSASLEVRIQDDGRGFLVETEPGLSRPGGFGLQGIVQRARMLGGKAVVQSSPGQGTIVFLRFPTTRGDNGD